MSFNGTEGRVISLTEATALTDEFKKEYPGETKGVFIGRDYIEALLAEDTNMGIRVYFGRYDNGGNTIVMVAADASEDDVLDLIINDGVCCPSRCGCADDLNS